jgi:hypothetical protein
MSEGSGSRLAVMIDGQLMAEEEGRALFREFSEHMDVNRGDMAGFAKKKGWASVLPEYQKGKAVLVVWTTAAPSPAQRHSPPKLDKRGKPNKRGKPKR